ncbi:STM4015 family protein [Streptomyces resistomycificus]|uniref:Cytoplasmic protein n=1 Tax=Streptomyces resistomycificus TaxID=67356 RepID=A0A0L8LWH8_9ACTN|nr:STM4015 family protein [Streptomyces resistomycificus]KOG42434.1 cytoplasmic protein [Streptomyces resistomycificus]KUN92585.1 cytoplasmic protein [Streptomyces resistomycificus]
MTIGDHLQALYRLPAHTFPGPDGRTDDLPDPDAFAWRVISDVYDADEDWTKAFARFCATVDTTRVRALIVGAWQEAYEEDCTEVIEALVAARDRFPALRALFLGDMVMEECEISWINQTDVTPLLAAFPKLEEFGVRGGSGLRFPAVRHDALRRLVIETGGLPAEVVRGVGGSDLPALEHLDLWLGTPGYGGDSEAADLEPILSGARLPRLRHLALRNSEMQDAVAAAVAAAPVVARLEVLDLSMGVLTDEGAAALLGGQPLTHLKKLDLHHHYLSEQFQERVRRTLETAGVEVDLDRDDAEEDSDGDGTVWRYVAIGE